MVGTSRQFDDGLMFVLCLKECECEGVLGPITVIWLG
jgi:hypothetical protein